MEKKKGEETSTTEESASYLARQNKMLTDESEPSPSCWVLANMGGLEKGVECEWVPSFLVCNVRRVRQPAFLSCTAG